jgi:hypothetical protein
VAVYGIKNEGKHPLVRVKQGGGESTTAPGDNVILLTAQ